jgi:hypothetical protein
MQSEERRVYLPSSYKLARILFVGSQTQDFEAGLVSDSKFHIETSVLATVLFHALF